MAALDDLGEDGVLALALTIADATSDALINQGKVLACNLITSFGDECFKPRGYVASVTRAFESSLFWLLAEGYVTLTEDGLSSEEEQARRVAERNETDDPVVASPLAGRRGDYL